MRIRLAQDFVVEIFANTRYNGCKKMRGEQGINEYSIIIWWLGKASLATVKRHTLKTVYQNF
jgi:hypothetical protein